MLIEHQSWYTQLVVYIAATTRNRERWDEFADTVRRQVPGGGELVNKAEEMVEIYGESHGN